MCTSHKRLLWAGVGQNAKNAAANETEALKFGLR
jgi:hypothetical protein